MAGCATETVVAQPTPLDVLFLLDTSSSMSDLVAPAESKWSAVTGAMARFVDDPSSAGMQVALELFPVPQPGVPASCTSNDACGAAGPCMLAACDDGSGTICATDGDCAPGSSCVPTGVCSADPQYLCPLGGAGGPSFAGLPCGSDPNGFDLGTCNPVVASTCVGGDDCASSDYATPPVPFAALPAAAVDVESALRATQPAGATPTVAALSGAITAAQARAAAVPDHTVVVVLATDGIPDEGAGGSGASCVAVDTATANAQADALAAAAYGASPSVSTFAIGVFTPDAASSGSSVLDGIAAAGGTGHAYVIGAVDVDGGASVEDAFAQALNQIRRASLPCRFDVPTPASGVADPGRVNVAFTPSSGATTTVPHVASASGCGTSDGWYFDAPPAGSSISTTLSVCPGTCSSLRADAGGRVDVVLGCETVAR